MNYIIILKSRAAHVAAMLGRLLGIALIAVVLVDYFYTPKFDWLWMLVALATLGVAQLHVEKGSSR